MFNTILSRVTVFGAEIFFPDRGCVALEIGEGVIKLSESVPVKGRREIVRLIKRPLTSDKEDSLARQVRSLFDAYRITSRKVILNIPRHLVTVRFLRFPSTSDDEIRRIIKTESLKHVPYSEEDIVCGYRVVERFNDGYSNVLLAIVPVATITSLMNILHRARLNTQAIALGSEGRLLWYLAARKTAQAENVFLVNVDADHIDIDFIKNGRLVFTRGVLCDNRGVLDRDKIIHQLRVSLAAYRKESNNTVDTVIVTGMTTKTLEYKDIITREFSLPVEIVDQLVSTPVTKDAMVETSDTSFVELVALTLQSNAVKVNLLPEPLQKRARMAALHRQLIVSVLLAGFFVLMVAGFVAKELHDKAKGLSSVTREMKKIESKVSHAKKMLRDINIVQKELGGRPLAIDVVGEVHKLTPAAVTLSMFDYESRQTLTLRGSASDIGEVFRYVVILERSPYFENVKVKYANKRISNGREVADFEIESAVPAERKRTDAAAA